ncbi:MAG: hypothetical protein ACD_71C00154G0004 [uncultured bacterium (gcode 4)]|uniref:SLH domain-containing protein n=1 Tax=uncultured bacterium (gcode 4) TaxID=1234023 RepID=K1Z4A5_9BACT|nr:MAG: hypothetical protein ACD_71C00154G0004 [uncultured bacterium (gcode 4)]
MKIFISFLILALSVESALADFADIQYNWYKTSILNLQKIGIVKGTDGNYSPEWLTTRAEMLKIIMGAAQIPLTTELTRCFPDVDPAKWYGQYICTAKKLKIAKGFENGTFQPNETITTLEALVFGLRAFGLTPTVQIGENWYTTYQDLADKNNILATHTYTTWTKISRGKAAELVESIYRYKVKKTPLSYGSLGCTLPNNGLYVRNTLMIDGMSREYNLSLPSDYSQDKQYNLVVAFHGRTSSNDMVQNYMGLQEKAGYWQRNKGGITQTDTIVAYPAGIAISGGYSWSAAANVEFFDAILQQVSNSYCINRDQIFIVGHSLGGWFANKLACLRWDVINGMSSVGGPWYAGNCTGPVASLIFQNVNDPLVSLASGKYAEKIRKAANQCTNVSTSVTVGSLSCKQWNDCTTGNPVTWCEGYSTYQNDPHGWPISGGTVILNWFRGLK